MKVSRNEPLKATGIVTCSYAWNIAFISRTKLWLQPTINRNHYRQCKIFFYGNLEVTPHGTLNISAYFMLHKVTSVSGRESPASNPTAIEPNVGCFEIAKKIIFVISCQILKPSNSLVVFQKFRSKIERPNQKKIIATVFLVNFVLVNDWYSCRKKHAIAQKGHT